MLAVTTGAGIALAGSFGLILGSFLNVVAYRLPRGESLATPGSRCPGCDTPIKPYDNVPVLSWLLLRGRCRACGMSIAWRYPLVELMTGILMALTVIVLGADRDVWLGVAFVALLVPITVIDIDFRIIPNKLTILGAVVAPAILALTDPGALPEHLIAGAAAGGFLLIAAVAYPAGMGMGDVKLAFVMGLFLGREVGVAMFVGARRGIADRRCGDRGQGRPRKAARRPSRSARSSRSASFVALFAGEPVVDWYLRTFA